MPTHRILVVSYPYPPMPSVGGNRWAAMAKYLRLLGYDVTVLTTSAFGTLPDDAESGVVRSPDLTASTRLRKLLRRPPLPAAGAPAPVDKPPSAAITRFVVPDTWLLTWVPGATRIARALMHDRRIDCVVTSSPYESTHLVGLALGRRRPAWIADFRDGWTFEPWRQPFPTRAQRALDALLERRVVQTADRVVAVHRPLADDFRARLGVEAVHIANAWDPDLEREVGAAEAPQLDSGQVTLVHTGKLLGEWGRDPGPLFEALRLVARDHPDLGQRLRLVLAGRLDTGEERMLAELESDGIVEHAGHLSRPSAVALQRRADALVLLTSPTVTWEAPGKLFEYLAAGRPILALAHGNEAARIVEETGTGVAVPPDDVPAIAEALRRVARGDLARAYAPRNLERYMYPGPAVQFAKEVELAIGRRR
jgi:glycosyltransferase involved in cell wall biosynthesis